MKRLFTVNGEHFETKKAAKAARGEGKPVIAEDGKLKGQVLYVKYQHTVSLGPDHFRKA